MGDHEIQSNIHSLALFCTLSKQFEDRIVIAVTGGIDVEMDTDMCKVRDTISVH